MSETSKGERNYCLPQHTQDSSEVAQQLLQIIADLTHELYPNLEIPFTLDSDLSKEIGLDSLTRVELFARVEKHFNISIPDSLLMKINTSRDLLEIILQTEIKADPNLLKKIKIHLPQITTHNKPDDANTLMEVLLWHQEKNGDKPHLYIQHTLQDVEVMTYQQLFERAEQMASGLRALGVTLNQPVALMLPTCADYFYAFFAILFAGGVAVPLYPPASYSQMEEHLRRQSGILKNAQCAILITVPEAKPIARLLKATVTTLMHVKTVTELTAETFPKGWLNRRASDIALLQYTSGSTGAPKGVILTHAMLLANIRIVGHTIQVNSDDIFVSWLPLYHDMGLIGAWLGSLYFAIPLVIMSPLSFLKQPETWLWTIHHYQATISAAPNFAYALCIHKILDKEIEGLDLGSWRLAFNGAEPVSLQTITQFTQRFSAYGFKPTALTPVYGLAEASLGLVFTPINRGPLIDKQNLDFTAVSSGQVLPGYQVRIVDDTDYVLNERQIGHLQFCGPSCTTGYYANPVQTNQLFHGQWLDSGDYAYVAKGEVFITGRVKEMMIRAGQHIFPYELEEALGNLPEIRIGRVAVFGIPDPQLGTERLIVLAETREKNLKKTDQLLQNINTIAVELLGSAPDEICLVPPGTLLKTSSGKMRRTAIKDLYQQGALIKGERFLWWQIARLTLQALPTLGKRFIKRSGELIYGAYSYICFIVLGLSAWCAALVLPKTLRFRSIRIISRTLLRLWGIPVQVNALSTLKTPCIIITNHSSYLDSLILFATLPEQLTFVGKKELAQHFMARIFFKKIGTIFVERFDFAQSAVDAQKISKACEKNDVIVFFPEGTFQRAPGLMPFHMGAFVIASAHHLPIIPISIKGSRDILPANCWLLRRGKLVVTLGDALYPQGSDWSAALALSEVARQALLQLMGEA